MKIIGDIKALVKNKYFYIGLFFSMWGIVLNFISQSYLNNSYINGKQFPALTDFFLDKLPYLPKLSWIYDSAALFALFVFMFFVLSKNQIKKVPYYLLLVGLFNMLRAIFIILTPYGAPSGFYGTSGLFHGFSLYELGFYPSGHAGGLFLYALLSFGLYRWIILSLDVIAILTLMLSRGHYSIDILSGLIFAYAIYCFGERHLKFFKLRKFTKARIMG